MTDQKPPRLALDERETLQTALQFQRESFVRKVSGVGEDAARQRFVGSDTTLLWLTKHLARAEMIWIFYRFAGQEKTAVIDDTVQPDDSLADVIALYRATWVRVDEIVAGASLDDLSRQDDGDGTVNLRWILAHLLEETARHAGHADILRELIDGETGR